MAKSNDVLPLLFIGIGAYFLLAKKSGASILPLPSARPSGGAVGYTGNTASNQIKWVQSALNSTISCGLEIDGIAGPKTRDCVKRFQEMRQIRVDGVIGPETIWELHSALGEPGYIETPNPYTPGASAASQITDGWY